MRVVRPRLTLLNLPTEIIDLILRVIDPKDRLSLSLVCKYLQQLNEPQLYRTINTRNQGGCDPQKVAKFLAEHPEVCKNVEVLHLKHYQLYQIHQSSENSVARLRYGALSSEGADRLRSLVDGLKAFEWRQELVYGFLEDGWFTEGPEGGVHEDALVGVLLAELSNLTELHLHHTHNMGFWLLSIINAWMNPPTSKLSCLKLIDLTFAHGFHPRNGRHPQTIELGTIAVCLALPTLRTLRLRGVVGEVNFSDAESAAIDRLALTGSSLEHLELYQAGMAADTVDNLLMWCQRSLKSFVLNMKGGSVFQGSEILDFPALVESLWRVRLTIRHLTVIVDSSDSFSSAHGPMQPLLSLEKLTHLKCDLITYVNIQRWLDGKPLKSHDRDFDPPSNVRVDADSFIDLLPPDLQVIEMLIANTLSTEDLDVIGSMIDAHASGKLPRLRKLVMHEVQIEWLSKRHDVSRTLTLGCAPTDQTLVPRRAGLTELYRRALKSGIELDINPRLKSSARAERLDADWMGLRDDHPIPNLEPSDLSDSDSVDDSSSYDSDDS